VHLVLRRVDGGVLATPLTDAGTADGDPIRLDEPGLPAFVAAHDAPGVRWVWDDTARWYPAVLAAGGRVGRCVDLRLCRRILRAALAARGSALAAAPADALDAPAADGGGAMQLPKGIRGAVVADPGWKLVVADAAQLEPRVLAAMAGDRTMAAAGDGRDLYDGVVASGAVETRQQAKVAMLGAMYGATQGEGGRLVPRLVRAFPRALDLVERAARAGERGEPVTTLLGRTSPVPEASWFEARNQAYTVEGTPAMQRAVESRARSWGRFTRNFVVQGTAAEWALAWMGSLRSRLTARFPGAVTDGPHLVFFVHDEIVVHAPEEHAEWVATQIREAAVDAGRLLFQEFPVTFPLSVAVVGAYSEAKD
jgi:DNA polymerase-1